MSMDNLSVNTGSSLRAKFDETFPNKISRGDNCQVLLYDRSTLVLSVWTNDDTNSISDPQKANYLYGDKIYNEDTDLLKSLETTMTKAGYVFAGWYTTSEFTPGTEYKPDENSAITANMNLYAKWEPNQFRAEYYLYMDDAAPYAWQGFAEGGKIDDKLVPSAVQDSFLGWYWYQNGQLVPFDFTSAVGTNHVDANGVLKLYAKWSGTTGKVSYLPGIGGDNAVGLHLRLEADVLRYRPERVFMMVGINGIGWPEDLTVARITYVAHEMLERGIRVWLGSICPLRFPDKWDRFQYQDRIVRVNARLAEWAAAHGCGFLDYHAALRDGDGQLRAEFARPDGTHLLLPAYVVMSRLVAPHLAR